MAQLTKSKLIELLHAAARDEHAAIIQYLRHAYMMGESELACEIEGIARDEMRHFWMLSRWIVKLGGDPTIERGFTDLAGADPPEWLQRDVAAEDRAIAMYRDIIAQLNDPDLKADLEHILGDEERHHREFNAFVAEAQAELAAAPEADPEALAAPEPPLAPVDKEALDWGVRHEYTAILQYLTHSFVIQDEEVSRQLEMQAINEMQHMGWFGEELNERGIEMPLDHHPVARPASAAAMLSADIQLERDTTQAYTDYLGRMSDPELQEVVDEARGQELYHESLFNRLLARLQRASSAGWTLGSLINKEKK
ncbi:MAG TPA: ferritin-like domain-containing protein [Chloroflexi bacterium]|nr:ferritin-like domain-containing protein [Chloroflexota bacterium]